MTLICTAVMQNSVTICKLFYVARMLTHLSVSWQEPRSALELICDDLSSDLELWCRVQHMWPGETWGCQVPCTPLCTWDTPVPPCCCLTPALGLVQYYYSVFWLVKWQVYCLLMGHISSVLSSDWSDLKGTVFWLVRWQVYSLLIGWSYSPRGW